MSSIWMMTMGFLSREPPSWHDLTLHRYLGHFIAARNGENFLSLFNSFFSFGQHLTGIKFWRHSRERLWGFCWYHKASLLGEPSPQSSVSPRQEVGDRWQKLLRAGSLHRGLKNEDKVKHYYAHDFPFEHIHNVRTIFSKDVTTFMFIILRT